MFEELGTWSVEGEDGVSEDEIRQAVGNLLTQGLVRDEMDFGLY